MRYRQLFSILLIIFTLVSCSAKQSKHSIGVQKHGIVADNSIHSYEIYLPTGYDSTKTYPVIFSFDSHGNGSTAIAGFKLGADKYGFILVGSNLIKNGISEYEKNIAQLISDVKSHFRIDEKAIYTAGFSGGARMANYYGLKNQVTGIISCGAGFKQSDIQNTGVQSYVYNIAGNRDCNFGETAYLPGSSECSADRYVTNTFNGIHEWPSSKELTEAVSFMYARLLIDKVREQSTVSLAEILDEKKTEIDSLKKTNDKLALYKKLEITAKMFSGNSDCAGFQAQIKAMEQDNAFIESLRAKQQALQMEDMLKQGYIKALTEEPVEWWGKEFKALNDSINSNRKSEMIDLMFRSKSFIGLACFSFTANSAKKKNIPELEKYLTIYEMAEPQNPDVFYYKSYLSMLKNQKEAIFENMKKAYGFGFEDSIRLQADFPADVVLDIKKFAQHSH